jgi:hypothetical protein
MLQSQRTGQFQLSKKNNSESKTRWFYFISGNWEWSGQVKNRRFIGGYLIVSILFHFQTMLFVLYQRQLFFCVWQPWLWDLRTALMPERVFNTHPSTGNNRPHVSSTYKATKCLTYFAYDTNPLNNICLWDVKWLVWKLECWMKKKTRLLL